MRETRKRETCYPKAFQGNAMIYTHGARMLPFSHTCENVTCDFKQ